MNFIDFLYIAFSLLTLYFSFLFLALFFRNRKLMNHVPKMSKSKLPSVSLIVPAHNEEKVMEKTIKNLKLLDYPKKLLEIIVVDDGSTDHGARIARSLEVKVISKSKGGKASAINTGIKAAKGQIVACIDADSFPKKNALLKSIPYFSDADVAAVTTKIFIENTKGFLGKLQAIEYAIIAWSRKLLEFVDGVYATPGPLSLYRKGVLESVGGFDEKNATEDIEIAWRLLNEGYKIKMAPAVTSTNAPTTWRRWLRQRLRWNIGGFQTALKYRNAMFRHKSSFGFFILPTFTLSYLVSLLALGVFVYLIYLWIFNNVLFIINALLIGINPFNSFSLLFTPDLFLILGIVMFLASLLIVKNGLKEINFPASISNLAYTLIYLTIYITIFPFLLAYSMVKFIQGYKEW